MDINQPHSPRSGRPLGAVLWCSLILVVLLAGCGESQSLEPIGIGPDRDALKRSPCACVELPQKPWGRS